MDNNHNTEQRRRASTSNGARPVSPEKRRTSAEGASRTVGTQRRTAERSTHPAVRKEPHYRSTGRPSSASKASRPAGNVAVNDDEEKGESTLVTSLLKAIIYIMVVLVISGCLSYFAISAGNDVFAFVKSDKTIKVTIDDGLTVKELGNVLQKHGVINYSFVFDLYAGVRGKSPTFVAGEYEVSPSMSYDELLRVFAKTVSNEKETIIVVIPEGYTVQKIVDTLVDKYGLSTKEELYDAIENYDFDYWFVDQLEGKTHHQRMHRLEGYLYPDTYYYYTDASAVTIINKMLRNFDVKMKQTFKNCTAPGNDYVEKINNLCKERGRTFDEIVNLASLVQMEAFYDIEYGTISSVFNNRLKNPGYQTNGFLESDATLYYILQDDPPEHLTNAHLEMNHPYNTRVYKGLPPGPITNPTYLAINYALYPENTNYYYFVSKKDGYSLFARTLKEHNNNVQIALGEGE